MIPSALGRPSRGSFFLTERGYQAASYGVEIAKVILARSARAVHLQMTLPFDPFFVLTTDHDVTLRDDRLPNRRVRGKVISYRLVIDGNTGVRAVEVVCAVSIGDPRDVPEPRPLLPLYAEDYDEGYTAQVNALYTYHDRLPFLRYDTQGPKDPFVHPSHSAPIT